MILQHDYPHLELPRSSPRQQVLEMILGYVKPQLVYVAAKLGIADQLCAGPKLVEELARLVEVEPRALYRLLKGLVNIGLVYQVGEKEFALTSLGECLVTGSLKEIAILQGEEMFRAWSELLYSVQTGKSAFEKVFGVNFFDYLQQHSTSQKRFNQFMASTSLLAARAFEEAYDFSAFRRVVDLGGGRGVLLATLLKANPHLNGVLFDLEEATAEAVTYLQTEGVVERCQVVTGNFFEDLPPDGDLYLLSQVIHDWNDQQALLLLKNCRQQMPSHARLLLFEHLMPEWVEPVSKAVQQDLCMLVLTGGKERTQTEFKNLFFEAGFELSRIIPTRHSRFILEAVLTSGDVNR